MSPIKPDTTNMNIVIRNMRRKKNICTKQRYLCVIVYVVKGKILKNYFFYNIIVAVLCFMCTRLTYDYLHSPNHLCEH